MKTLILAAALLSGFAASAAQVNLQSGDQVIIQPNISTTITCGGDAGNGSTCDDAIKGLQKLMGACQTGSATSYCIDKYWPKFRTNNPSCALAHIEICLNACETGSAASYCADKCN